MIAKLARKLLESSFELPSSFLLTIACSTTLLALCNQHQQRVKSPLIFGIQRKSFARLLVQLLPAIMVELRKRKTPPPAPAPAPKKERKAKATKANGKSETAAESAAEPAAPEPSAAPAAAPEPESKATSGPPKPGDKIDFDGFGGEIETNDGRKVTLKALVDESKEGLILFTYPKASTPGCEYLRSNYQRRPVSSLASSF